MLDGNPGADAGIQHTVAAAEGILIVEGENTVFHHAEETFSRFGVKAGQTEQISNKYLQRI